MNRKSDVERMSEIRTNTVLFPAIFIDNRFVFCMEIIASIPAVI